MVDIALIQQCADPALKPEFVEQFVERAGSLDPLSVTVRSGSRLVLVPKPTTSDDAMELIRKNIGRNTIRVGITQYPAGLGIMEAGELKPDIVDACANLKMGTALFAKVYRIVMKWYGNPADKEVLPQVFDDAILAWQTGYFEGTAVFRAPDPGVGMPSEPRPRAPSGEMAKGKEDRPRDDEGPDTSGTDAHNNPYEAGMRVDLSGIGGSR